MKEITNRYIYCTTNLINNMEYVGRRTCHCAIEEDDYLGSGTAFLKALKLYGR